jgi:ATP-dependent Clp protease ATP-binding subunit ClpA
VLENFSVGAQRVVSLATVEARRLGHPRIGTEHLLLGVLADDDCEPAAVLRAAGASLAAARHKVIEASGADPGVTSSEPLPFTPRARRALERAGRFSRKEQEPEVTAAHLLLGVLDVEGVACQVLRGIGVDIERVRDAIVSRRVDVPVVAPDDDEPEPELDVVQPRCPSCHSLLEGALRETLMPVQRDGESTMYVSLVSCAACGAALGVMRPKSR